MTDGIAFRSGSPEPGEDHPCPPLVRRRRLRTVAGLQGAAEGLQRPCLPERVPDLAVQVLGELAAASPSEPPGTGPPQLVLDTRVMQDTVTPLSMPASLLRRTGRTPATRIR